MTELKRETYKLTMYRIKKEHYYRSHRDDLEYFDIHKTESIFPQRKPWLH